MKFTQISALCFTLSAAHVCLAEEAPQPTPAETLSGHKVLACVLGTKIELLSLTQEAGGKTLLSSDAYFNSDSAVPVLYTERARSSNSIVIERATDTWVIRESGRANLTVVGRDGVQTGFCQPFANEILKTLGTLNRANEMKRRLEAREK